MSQYSSRPEALGAHTTDDMYNPALLCSHLHCLFNQRCFTLVPKAGVRVVHAPSGLPCDELAALYHNVALHPLCGLAVEYVFARFSWTVLTQGTFLRVGVPRRLVVVEGVASVKNVSGLAPFSRRLWLGLRAAARVRRSARGTMLPRTMTLTSICMMMMMIESRTVYEAAEGGRGKGPMADLFPRLRPQVLFIGGTCLR